jgi:hypothetical protein
MPFFAKSNRHPHLGNELGRGETFAARSINWKPKRGHAKPKTTFVATATPALRIERASIMAKRAPAFAF